MIRGTVSIYSHEVIRKFTSWNAVFFGSKFSLSESFECFEAGKLAVAFAELLAEIQQARRAGGLKHPLHLIKKFINLMLVL